MRVFLNLASECLLLLMCAMYLIGVLGGKGYWESFERRKKIVCYIGSEGMDGWNNKFRDGSGK